MKKWTTTAPGSGAACRLVMPGVFAAIIIFSACRQEPTDYIRGYYPLVYQGDLAFFKGDYETAYRALKRAVEMKRPPNAEPYRELEKLANVCAVLGKPEEALTYVDQLIERGYTLQPFQQDSAYAPLWAHPRWQALTAAYPARRAAYLQQVDHDLRKEIAGIIERDQRYRARPDRHAYRQQQLQLDSINIARLKHILDTRGYPNSDLIGHASVDELGDLDIEPVLLHTPDSIRQAYFIPRIRTLVEAGQCPPRILGKLIDQSDILLKGYQLYGTMISPGGTVDHVKDPERLEERRRSIGLPTLRFDFQRDSIIRVMYLMN